MIKWHDVKPQWLEAPGEVTHSSYNGGMRSNFAIAVTDSYDGGGCKEYSMSRLNECESKYYCDCFVKGYNICIVQLTSSMTSGRGSVTRIGC